MVKMDKAEALSRPGELKTVLALVIFGVSVVIVLAAFFIADHLINPIYRLTRVAELFSRGELDARVDVESTDEIGILSDTFNVMAESLRTAKDDLESRVEERTADLKRSNQELERFAYVASHDLQEPLRMVSSYTQLLSRRYTGKLDSDADEFIGFAVDGAKRMQVLINDLLTYSRAGRHTGEYEEQDTNDVVEEALRNLEGQIKSAGTTVIYIDLPAIVADRLQLVSIFQNLIGNSVKYRAANRDSEIEITADRQGSS
jgi:signal transduction histidine kinase